MSERVHTFGSHGGLVGVLTEPEGPASPGRPVVIVANIGLNHRVGPGRMYVDLARRLAGHGFMVLRFDLSGLGDSAMRRDDRTDLQRGVVDLQEAMDYLAQKKGAARFILIGLCSGVDPVHGVSRGDPRVVGAVHIDGYTYPTSEFRLRHLTLRKLQTARWRRYARRLYTTKITKDIRVETGDAPEIFDRDYPPREQFRDDVNKMTSAGTRLLLVYTGTVDSAYNYERQAYDMLAPLTHRDNIEVALHERADHLYTSLTERRRLFVLLEGWMIRHFTL